MSLAAPPGTSAYIVYIVSMLPELQSSCLQYLENEKKYLSHSTAVSQAQNGNNNGGLPGLVESLPAVYEHVLSALSLLRRINEAMTGQGSMSSSYAIQTPCPTEPQVPPRSPNAFNALIATGVSWQGPLPKPKSPRPRARPRDDKLTNKPIRRKYERRKKSQPTSLNNPDTSSSSTSAALAAAKLNLKKCSMIGNLDSRPRVVPGVSENAQQPQSIRIDNTIQLTPIASSSSMTIDMTVTPSPSTHTHTQTSSPPSSSSSSQYPSPLTIENPPSIVHVSPSPTRSRMVDTLELPRPRRSTVHRILSHSDDTYTTTTTTSTSPENFALTAKDGYKPHTEFRWSKTSGVGSIHGPGPGPASGSGSGTGTGSEISSLRNAQFHVDRQSPVPGIDLAFGAIEEATPCSSSHQPLIKNINIISFRRN